MTPEQRVYRTAAELQPPTPTLRESKKSTKESERGSRMFTGFSTTGRKETSTRSGARVAAIACALALTVSLAGNAAAYQLERDDSLDRAPLVTPKFNPQNGLSQHIVLKLRTTIGRQVLMFG
jgi:hypothetical protein